MIKTCNDCKYFRRFYIKDDKGYIATIYGLCKKKNKVCSEKYYCSNYKSKRNEKEYQHNYYMNVTKIKRAKEKLDEI